MTDPQIGKYRIMGQLSRGGMGEVLLAEHAVPGSFERVVVVKRVLAHLSRDPQFVALFLREAKVSATLSHPNLVSVFDLFEENGHWHMVLEFVHGVSARALIEQAASSGRPMSSEVVVAIAVQVLRGLEHAHQATSRDGKSAPIVHRDVTPENILVGFNGVVKLADFGIARAQSESAAPTMDGVIRGKLNYVAPELLARRPFDGRADLYSFGVVLFEMLSGALPRRPGQDSLSVRPGSLNSSIPTEVERVAMRCLEPLPERRFASAEACAEALERWLGTRAVSAPSLVKKHILAEFEQQSKQPVQHLVDVKRHTRPLTAAQATHSSHEAPTQMLVERKPMRLALRVALAVLFVAAMGLVVASFTNTKKDIVTPSTDRTPGEPDLISDIVNVDAGVDSGLTSSLSMVDAGSSSASPEKPLERIRKGETAARRRVRTLASGKLLVLVNPWGEVRVDGTSVGTTPLPAFSLSAGTHKVTVSNPQLKVRRERKITISPDETELLRIDLERP
jgi:serine/threonine protein kinase